MATRNRRRRIGVLLFVVALLVVSALRIWHRVMPGPSEASVT